MGPRSFGRRYVYGALQRLLHWWLALATLGGVVTGGLAAWGVEAGAPRALLLKAHVRLGWALAAGVALRLLWGLVGPEPSRIGALWRAARRAFRRTSEASPPFAYEPEAGVAYLAFYALLLASVVTGGALAAIRYDLGPLAATLFDDFSRHALFLLGHQASSFALAAFVIAHLYGMTRHETSHGYPVAQAMVSGFKYAPDDEEKS